jgi:serine/threonine protein kinase
MTVEQVCGLMARSRVLSATGVRQVHRRWVREAGRAAADVQRFAHWLTTTRYLTRYQVERLLHGHTDCLFLDQYKILRRIGEGSLARVYKALRADGRVVALKVLPPSRARDPHLRAAFEREARASWRLKHPNVVRTLDTGEADGVRYIVMEYLEGETLADVLRRRGRLPPAEAVRLIYQAFLGLQHIHECGLVHGRVELANLMLTPAPGKGEPDTTLHATVKILDAGMGASFFAGLAESAAGHLRRTGEGALLLNANDVAPEQACNLTGSDIRADIYGLGCVLYHCLTGRPPFAEGSVFAQLLRHATEAPRPLCELDATIPEGLQRVVDKLLAKDPALRYPTPEAAARALRAFLPAPLNREPSSAGTRGPAQTPPVRTG